MHWYSFDITFPLFLLQPFHAAPAALNAFHNIYLKQITGNQALSLRVTNHPLPRGNAATVSLGATICSI